MKRSHTIERITLTTLNTRMTSLKYCEIARARKNNILVSYTQVVFV